VSLAGGKKKEKGYLVVRVVGKKKTTEAVKRGGGKIRQKVFESRVRKGHSGGGKDWDEVRHINKRWSANTSHTKLRHFIFPENQG